MAYCLNPTCANPADSQNHSAATCPHCGNAMLLQGQFRALKPIGQGGFGRTFLAVDEQSPRKTPCVIKQSMPDQLTHREQAEALFQQEALRLAELGEHAQIPQLIAHCQEGSYQYLVQEWIDGQTLAQTLRDRGPFSPADIEHILHSLLPVLEFIHAQEVIHRDIKPDNIIRRADGQLVLVDFGAAKHATGTALLKTGTSIGSAEFIAPEQARGKATYTSDLYSLGVTCVHLLTQMSPFDLIDGDNQWVWQDWFNGPISPELQYGLNRMIAHAPNQRFQSASEVREFLANPQLPETKPAPTPLPKVPVPVAPARSPRLRKPLTITAIAAFSVGAIAAAITLPRLNAEANRAKQSEAKAYVGAMGRAQQAYFLENNKFATDLNALGLGIRNETESFSYKIPSQGKTPEGFAFVQNVAIPKKGDLKSYVSYVWITRIQGATVANEDTTTASLLCESNQPTVQIPGAPGFSSNAASTVNNDFTTLAACPTGYTRISR